MEKAAVFSYIRSKGLYAGIEITGTVRRCRRACDWVLTTRCLSSDSMRMGTCTIGRVSRPEISYVLSLNRLVYADSVTAHWKSPSAARSSSSAPGFA